MNTKSKRGVCQRGVDVMNIKQCTGMGHTSNDDLVCTVDDRMISTYLQLIQPRICVKLTIHFLQWHAAAILLTKVKEFHENILK